VTAVDVWESVVGQPDAVAQLRAAIPAPTHAWLFVGPPGSGTKAAARAFAAELLSAGAGPEEAERHRRLALAGQHPDLTIVERVGARILVEQAKAIIHRASRSPAEGDRKVIVLDEFHLVEESAAAKLLKTIEEPAPGTFFVVLAEEVPPELVTIASRCTRVDFPALSREAVLGALAADGVDPERAAAVADAAHGDLDRARLLTTDERLALRLASWRELPARLDGTGHTAAALVDEVRAGIDDAVVPLAARHRREAAALKERVERYGQRGSGATDLVERHRREQRRLRTDELRLGFTELARRYRDDLTTAEETGRDPGELLEALAAVQGAVEALVRFPSEELLLQSLFVRLPRLAGQPSAAASRAPKASVSRGRENR